MKLINRLAHLCLRTEQFPEMIAFYRDTLGLPIKFGLKDDEGTTFGYYFDLGNQTFIEIFDHQGAARQWSGLTNPLERPPVTHYSHFCFESDDLQKLKHEWESKGVKCTDIKMGLDSSYQMWISDPDGNAIEVMQYTPQSLQLAV